MNTDDQKPGVWITDFKICFARIHINIIAERLNIEPEILLNNRRSYSKRVADYLRHSLETEGSQHLHPAWVKISEAASLLRTVESVDNLPGNTHANLQQIRNILGDIRNLLTESKSGADS